MSTAATPPLSELSLSQLLDAFEKAINGVAKGNSRDDSTMVKQIDDVVSRISGISRRAKNIRNSLVPINKIPPETLALVATFFEPGRQLVNATAVCQYWRATLLSSPRLWNVINCSARTMFETYLKRSKSVPLQVQLRNTSLHLLESLAPDVSRLSSLTLVMRDSFGFEQLACNLGNPIPTLNEFSIVVCSGTGEIKIPPGISNDHFLHVTKLHLVRVSSLRAPRAFPHVTELKWITRPCHSVPLPAFLETLVELPALERVEIVFLEFSWFIRIIGAQMVTLPNVRRMSIRHSGGDILNLTGFLELPSLTSFVMSGIRNVQQPFAILPLAPLGGYPPNFALLPEMEVVMDDQQIHVSFRSHSQATLDYYIEQRPPGRGRYDHCSIRCSLLPVDSIRSLVVDMGTTDGDDEWVASLSEGLGNLVHLEFRARCGYTPQYLRQMIMEGNHDLETLTVYFGSECEARKVGGLEDVVDGLDSGISVTWVEDG